MNKITQVPQNGINVGAKYFGYLLFTLFIVLFPLGQLLRIESQIYGVYVVIHPIDLVTLFSLPYLFLVKKEYRFKYLGTVLFILTSSWIFALGKFKFSESLTGLMYLIRIISYYSFALCVNYIAKGKKIRKLILGALLTSITAFMLYGFYQYIFFYDLRDLFYSGWDDHYFRFTSTLLDPGYTAVVLITGLVILLKTKIKSVALLKYVLIPLYLLSIILTFSRAGYITLLFALLYTYKRHFKKIVFIFLVLLSIVLIVPKPRSSGVELLRTFSIFSRIQNYSETIGIFSSNPLFGVGFNNICQYRLKYLNTNSAVSHSCSGSDSSLLLLLATSGLVGLMTFSYGIYNACRTISNNRYGNLLFIIFALVLVSSFFNNSLFYNFIMGILAILLGLTKRRTIPGSTK